MAYERDNVRRMSGYLPGEQPGGSNVVKLNTNENPYPPAEAVRQALRGFDVDRLRRYPNPTAEGFRAAAAEAHGLKPQNVVATNAGDELLRLAIATFVEPGRPIGTAEPSYSLYPVLAEAHGSPVVSAALNDDWSIPDDLAARMNDAGVNLTLLVNPHAPSGRLTEISRLREIAANLNGVLLIDEAYVDFVDPELNHDTAGLAKDLDNVLILRTLSKGYGLAGLRFGYGLGAASLIEPILTKTRDSYNTDAIAQTLAEAAIRSRDQAAETWRAVREQRGRLSGALTDLGFRVDPSQANFILAAAPDGPGGGARAIHEALKARDIHVRYFDAPRLNHRLRITVGTPDENDALLKALGEILRS